MAQYLNIYSRVVLDKAHLITGRSFSVLYSLLLLLLLLCLSGGLEKGEKWKGKKNKGKKKKATKKKKNLARHVKSRVLNIST
jgi:hypothetical protein